MTTLSNDRPFRSTSQQRTQREQQLAAQTSDKASPAAVRAPVSADVVNGRRHAHVHHDHSVRERLKAKATREGQPSPEGHEDGYAPPPTKAEALKRELGELKDVKDPGAIALDKRLSKVPGFNAMDPADQAQVRDLAKQAGDVGTLTRKRLNKALSDPAFAGKSAEEQQQAIYEAAEPRLPPSAEDIRDALSDDPAFKKLDKAGQRAIKKMLSGPDADRLAATMGEQVQNLSDPEKTPAQREGVMQALAARAELMARKDIPAEAREWAAESFSQATRRFGNAGPYANAFREMLRSPSFNKLSAEQKAQAVGESTRLFEEAAPDKAADVDVTRKSLANDPAYKAMPDPDRNTLDRLINGDTQVSKAARARIDKLKSNPLYQHASTAGRARMLANIQNLGGVPHGVDSQLPSPTVNGQAKVTATKDLKVGDPEVAPGPATQHTVTVTRGKRSFHVDVVMPQQLEPGMKAPSLEQIKNALTRLPDDQLTKMKRIVVAEGRDPNGGSMSTEGGGKVNIYPTDNARVAKEEHDPGTMAEILTHEVGHIASIQPWGEDMQSKGWKNWKAAMASDGVRPSSYAGTNPAEDYAEAYAAYTGTLNDPKAHAAYRKLFPNRFAIIDEMVAGQNRS
jgi:hypothetical protein